MAEARHHGQMWPTDAESLTREQAALAAATPERWRPVSGEPVIGACWVCFPRGLTGRGDAGDPAWTAAAVMRGERVIDQEVRAGAAWAAYVPGLLALRIGPLLSEAVRGLRERPDVLMVDATGRDHPRGAGLARHLGAELDLPTVGVTHRPLRAEGAWPDDERGATSPLRIGGDVVGCWMRTRVGTRPLAVHPGWRTDLDSALEVVARTTGERRTPEPLRRARHLAREARNAAGPR